MAADSLGSRRRKSASSPCVLLSSVSKRAQYLAWSSGLCPRRSTFFHSCTWRLKWTWASRAMSTFLREADRRLTLSISRSCEWRKAKALNPPAPASRTTAAAGQAASARREKRSCTHAHPSES